MNTKQKRREGNLLKIGVLIFFLIVLLNMSSLVFALNYEYDGIVALGRQDLRNYTFDLSEVPSHVLNASLITWSCDFNVVPSIVYIGENEECFCIDTNLGRVNGNGNGYGNLLSCLKNDNKKATVKPLVTGPLEEGQLHMNLNLTYLTGFVDAIVTLKESTGRVNLSKNSKVECVISDFDGVATGIYYSFYKYSRGQSGLNSTMIGKSVSSTFDLVDSKTALKSGDLIKCGVELYQGSAAILSKYSNNTLLIDNKTISAKNAYLAPINPTKNESLNCYGFSDYTVALSGSQVVRHQFKFFNNSNNILLGTDIVDSSFVGAVATSGSLDLGTPFVVKSDEVYCEYTTGLYDSGAFVGGDSLDIFITDYLEVANSKPTRMDIDAVYLAPGDRVASYDFYLGIFNTIVDDEGGFDKLNGVTDIQIKGDLLFAVSEADSAFVIINISDLSNPVLVSQVYNGMAGYGFLNGVHGLVVKGNYAFTTSRWGASFGIINISDPSLPSKMFSVSDGNSGFNYLNGMYDLDIDGNFAYLSSSFEDALTIVDISDLLNPVVVSEIVDGVGGFNRLDLVKGVLVQDDYLYAAGMGDNGVTIINVSNKSSPVLVAELVDGVGGFNKLKGPRNLFILDDILYVASSSDHSLTIINVSDKSSPTLLAEIYDGDGTYNELRGAVGVGVKNGYAYVLSLDDDSLTIIDVRNPSAPILIREISDGENLFDKLEQPEEVAFYKNYIFVTGFLDDAISIIDLDA